MIFGNTQGFLMVFSPLVPMALAMVYLPDEGSYSRAMIGIWGIIVFIWDVVYRLLHREAHWLSPSRGGHIYFIPAFIFGAGAIWWYAQSLLGAVPR